MILTTGRSSVFKVSCGFGGAFVMVISLSACLFSVRIISSTAAITSSSGFTGAIAGCTFPKCFSNFESLFSSSATGTIVAAVSVTGAGLFLPNLFSYSESVSVFSSFTGVSSFLGSNTDSPICSISVFCFGVLSANTTSSPESASGSLAASFSAFAFAAAALIVESFAISEVTDIAGCCVASAFPTGVYGFLGILSSMVESRRGITLVSSLFFFSSANFSFL